MKSVACIGAIGLLISANAAAPEDPYTAVAHGTKCDMTPDGALHCRYRVGASLEFVLTRVGEPDVALDVRRDNREGDYTLDPVRHGPCLFVRYGWAARPAPGMEYSYATVSLVNGQVYRTLERCRLAR